MVVEDSKVKATLKDYSKVSISQSQNPELSAPNIHVNSTNKITKKRVGGPVATITQQSMRYFNIKDIESDTGYLERDWTLFALKELSDNSYDWLNYHYPAKRPEDKETRKITVRIWISSDRLLHIAVRNSNIDDIPVFLNLDKTFDYDLFYSTKRNQNNMTTGGLGDALKRILGMGYAIWTNDFNADESLEEKQWNEPIKIRANGNEVQVYLKVFISIGKRSVTLKSINPTRNIGVDTEVEVSLPLVNYVYENSYLLKRLRDYFQIYKLAKSRTYFDFYCDAE